MKITEKQKNLLKFIKDYQAENGKCPEFEEMAKAMGVSIGAVQARLYAMTDNKIIRRRTFYDIEII